MAFDSCDINGAQRVGQVKVQDGSRSGVITLPPSLLSIDDNYFLGTFNSTITLKIIQSY